GGLRSAGAAVRDEGVAGPGAVRALLHSPRSPVPDLHRAVDHPAVGLNVRRNTLLLAATMAIYSAVLQLVAAVSSITFVLVTGVTGLLGLGAGGLLTGGG